MFTSNTTKIQCKITDTKNTTIEGSVYLEQRANNLNSIRVILDPKILSDDVRRNFKFPAKISGVSELGEEIFVPSFWRDSESHHYHPKYTIEWTGSGDTIYHGIGLEKMINKKKDISIRLTIPFSILTSSEPHIEQEMGELKIKESRQINLEWDVDKYKYSIHNLFTTNQEKNHANSILEVKKECFVTIQFTNNKLSVFKDIVNDALISFEKNLPILEFLGKKRLDWYELEAVTVNSTGDLPFFEIHAYRQNNISINSDVHFSLSWMELPVTLEALNNNLIEQLIISLNSHKNRKAIIRAIQYLLSSYEEKYLFSKLVAAYTSFETLVAELSSTQKIDATIHGDDYKNLHEAINTYLNRNISDEEKREKIMQKVTELKRPAIKTTFRKLFNSQDYPLSRFMFKNADWEKNMSKLISRRNTLVHAGEVKDEHYLDLFRLHLLLQLWILKLLGCPDKYVNEYLANSIRNIHLLK